MTSSQIASFSLSPKASHHRIGQWISLFFILLFTLNSYAQEDLLSLLDTNKVEEEETVFATFKTSRIMNMQTIETVSKRGLDFRVSHRFGDIISPMSGHNLAGFDNSEDIRITFDYGVTRNWSIGFSRNKNRELLELYTKWRFMEQTTKNKRPVSMALYSCVGFTPIVSNVFYANVLSTYPYRLVHRFSYFTQWLIARKFNRYLSAQIAPSYHHRNFVRADVNSSNKKEDQNGLLSLSAGARIKLTKRMAVLIDYFHTFSEFRTQNKSNPYYAPLGIGFEIETGGHVFHLGFTNNGALSETNFVPSTQSNWLKGQFKFGFSMSRVFSL